MSTNTKDNDGWFPDDSPVLVKYPRTPAQMGGDRADWPWVPGWIVSQCGPDEWEVCVEDRGLAVLEDGSVPPPGTPEDNLLYPVCFRDSTEIRRAAR